MRKLFLWNIIGIFCFLLFSCVVKEEPSKNEYLGEEKPGLIPKLFGAKIILDIHDIVPEFYMSKFNAKEKSVFYKLLLFVEKISCMFSDQVIIMRYIQLLTFFELC